MQRMGWPDVTPSESTTWYTTSPATTDTLSVGTAMVPASGQVTFAGLEALAEEQSTSTTQPINITMKWGAFRDLFTSLLPQDLQGRTTLVDALGRLGSLASKWAPPAWHTLGEDGTFKLEGLMPGRVVVHAQCGGEERYVKSILVGEEDVLGKEVDAAALAAGIKVILRTDTASVSGALDVPEEKRDPAKQPRIVLIPTDERLRRAGFIDYSTVDLDYHFSSKSVRPGEYLAFAFAEADNSSFDDPDFLRVVESKGVKVKLTPGESQTVDLKLTPWPEEFADRLQ